MGHGLKKFQKLLNNNKGEVSGHMTKSDYRALKELGVPIKITKENDCYLEIIIKK